MSSSFGSITVYYAGKYFDQKFLLLGENHSIRDGESELVRELRNLKKHCEFFFEQDPVEKICNNHSTLDKLACSRKIADYNLSSCCNIDYRIQFVEDLYTELSKVRKTIPTLYTKFRFAVLVYFLRERPQEFIVTYSTVLFRYLQQISPRKQVDVNLLRNCCKIVWNVIGEYILGIDIDDLCENYVRTGIMLKNKGEELSKGTCDNLLQLKIIPVHECLVMYLILKNQYARKTIVYVAGESHVKWLVRSLAFYKPEYVCDSTNKPNNLETVLKFVSSEI